MNHHGISTQDDDDNFLSLECDENLYEEDQLNYDLEEEEKVVIHPTKGNQGFVKFKSSKQYQNHKPVLNNPVDDTIPDFGYMSNHRENNMTGKLKDNKVILNKDQPEFKGRKIPKVIKNSKNNENSDPFICLTINPEEESPAKHVNKAQEDEEFSRRISSIAEQYDFNYGFEEIDQNPEFRDDDFLFSQIDCDEELQSKSKSSEKNKSGSMDYDDYKFQEYSNMIKPPRIDTDPIPTTRKSKTGGLSKKISMPNLEEQRSLAASKLLNYLISIEGVYAPDPSYFQNSQPEISSIMRAILLDWMMEV